MTAVTLKGLLGRKFRAILTALAIVLGVAMVSGTYVLTDTISKAFDNIFSGSYRNTSAVISGKQIVNSRQRERDDPRVAARAREAAPWRRVGRRRDLRPELDLGLREADRPEREGDRRELTHVRVRFRRARDSRFNPLSLIEGAWASGSGEVVIDAATANGHDFAVGDQIRVSAQGPIRTYRIAGIAKFGSVDSLGGATIAVFDVPTAQKLLHKEGVYDAIAVASRSGVSPRGAQAPDPADPPGVGRGEDRRRAGEGEREGHEGVHEVHPALPARFRRDRPIRRRLRHLQHALDHRRATGARVRHPADARRLSPASTPVGAARGARDWRAGVRDRAVPRPRAREGALLVFSRLNLDLPKSGTVFATRTVVVSLLLGLAITLLASLAPALRATRVPPILAVREGATLPRGRLAPFASAIAAVLIAIGIGLLSYAMFVGGASTKQRLGVLALGVLVLFVGVALISSRVIRPIAAVVGAPAEHVGGPAGRLARENVVRNPGRTASTAAALMVGLALVTVVAVLGAGLLNADKDALKQQVRADYVVTSKNGFDPFPTAAGEAVVGVKGVQTVWTWRTSTLGSSAPMPPSTGSTRRLSRRSSASTGTRAPTRVLGRLGLTGAVIRQKFADKHGLNVGDPFALTTPDGEHYIFEVRGISPRRRSTTSIL